MQKLPSLSSLYLYLSDRCNLRCRHCWISPEFSNEAQSGVPLAWLKKIIHAARDLGLASVKLTGGEPFLYREIRPLLKFLAAEDLTVYIETNGSLLNASLVNHLRHCAPGLISVSLDGASPAVHDSIRGVRGCFEATRKGLRILTEAGLPVQVIMTLQRKNCEEIPNLIALCEEIGAESLKINHLLPCGRARQRFEHRENLPLEELIALYNEVDRRWARRSNLEIFFDLPVAFRSAQDLRYRGINECRIFNILSVLANGDYSICGIGQCAEELRLGSVYTDSLEHLWTDHPILKDLRASLPAQLEPPCRDCIFRYQCLGSCRANAYVVSGSLQAAYFLCMDYKASGRFPGSRIVEP